MAYGHHSGADVAVIGGGLVGTAIAFGLVRLGRSVVILDEGEQGLGATRGNFGLVWVQGKGLGLPAYGAWTRWSADHWKEFAADLHGESGIDSGYSRPGGLVPALSGAHLTSLDDELQRLNAQSGFPPHSWEVLDQRALRQRVPLIGPEVAGAIYCSEDGAAHPLRLWRALHICLAQRGVRHITGCRVTSVSPQSGGFTLKWNGGQLRVGQVVLAAGLGNRTLARQVGLEAPVRPSRGHILVTERTAPFLDQLLLTIRQTEDGSVMIGDSREAAGFDTGVNPGILAEIARRATRILPALGRLNVVRSWSALRIMSPDGFPIYQESTAFPGAWLVTCHSGVTLAAAHARRLSQIIDGRESQAAIASFGARRFHVPAAA